MSINSDLNRISETLNPASNQSGLSNSLKPADSSSAYAFDQAMNEPTSGTTDSLMQQLQELLQMLIEVLTKANEAASGGASGQSDSTQGGSIPAGGDNISPVEGSGNGGSAGGSELIPKPSEHLQTLNLGGKNVVVGGDGTASAEEVQATAGAIENMYQNSPTFRNMIDSSSDPDFEVSVGRRSDNTSWGNTTGKLFMNVNSITPGNSDAYQSLLGHEFAHASIDLGHGSQMEQIENAIAREA